MPVDLDFLRRGYEAWNAGNLDAVAGSWAPDVELVDGAAMPDAARTRGRDAVREHLSARVADVGRLTLRIVEIETAGESRALLGLEIEIVGHRSGAATTQRAWHVVTVGPEGVERIEEFFERGPALAAARG